MGRNEKDLSGLYYKDRIILKNRHLYAYFKLLLSLISYNFCLIFASNCNVISIMQVCINACSLLHLIIQITKIHTLRNNCYIISKK